MHSDSQRVGNWNGTEIIRIPGRLSNLYVLTNGDTAVLVDTGMPSDVRRVLQELSTMSKSDPVRLEWIVLTHLHADHVAGTDYAVSETGAKLGIGAAAKRFLDRERIPMPSLRQWTTGILPVWAESGFRLPGLFDWRRFSRAGFPGLCGHFKASVARWFEDGDTLPGVSGWRVVSLPGHTADSIGLLDERHRVLIAGDSVVNAGGKARFNSVIHDRQAMARTVEFICDLDLALVLPGHGSPTRGRDVCICD